MTKISEELYELIKGDYATFTKKDLERVKTLNQQYKQCIKDKYEIDVFNKLHTCRFDKCKEETNSMMEYFKTECKKNKNYNFCPHLKGKLDTWKKVLKVTDSVQLGLNTVIEREGKKRIAEKSKKPNK